MDKQKQIEEMAYVIYKYGQTYDDCVEGAEHNLAKHLVNAGYRKIPEGAVVLTGDELRLYNENIERDRAKLKTIRKETAEKFAERLKARCEYNRKQYCCNATVGAKDIEEIRKEITEGK